MFQSSHPKFNRVRNDLLPYSQLSHPKTTILLSDKPTPRVGKPLRRQPYTATGLADLYAITSRNLERTPYLVPIQRSARHRLHLSHPQLPPAPLVPQQPTPTRHLLLLAQIPNRPVATQLRLPIRPAQPCERQRSDPLPRRDDGVDGAEDGVDHARPDHGHPVAAHEHDVVRREVGVGRAEGRGQGGAEALVVDEEGGRVGGEARGGDVPDGGAASRACGGSKLGHLSKKLGYE